MFPICLLIFWCSALVPAAGAGALSAAEAQREAGARVAAGGAASLAEAGTRARGAMTVQARKGTRTRMRT